MIAAACIAGVTGGLTITETLSAISNGFGSTLGTIGIIIGLGVMMGRILEVSGGAERIAYGCIQWLGKRREEWALALTGYLVSIPIFADSAFVILFPIAKALSQRGGRPLIMLGVALAGGLLVTHTIVPPTPGPLGVAGIYNVDIGAMMMFGMVMAIPCVLSFVWYAQWLGRQYQNVGAAAETIISTEPSKELPSLTVSLIPIVVPILLILLKAVVRVLPDEIVNNNSAFHWVIAVIEFTGAPVIALCISTLLAVYLLVPHLSRRETAARLEEGLQSAGIILMVTGAGGALGFVVRESGTGAILAEHMAALPFSPIMIPFLVSTAIRLIQGSATVAMITAASITAPILAEIPGVNMQIAAQAAVCGSFFFSYFNDSLFWVVNRLMGITEVRWQLLSMSIPTTIAWAVAGMIIAIINLFFGNGSWLDLLIPLTGMGVMIFVIRRQR
jgi:gluconate transporter